MNFTEAMRETESILAADRRIRTPPLIKPKTSRCGSHGGSEPMEIAKRQLRKCIAREREENENEIRCLRLCEEGPLVRDWSKAMKTKA